MSALQITARGLAAGKIYEFYTLILLRAAVVFSIVMAFKILVFDLVEVLGWGY